MRILIDLQSAQNNNRQRGIGRYSLALAKSIARNCGNHEILIMLNVLFPETIEEIKASFSGLIPDKNFLILSVHGPLNEIDEQNIWRIRTTELVREQFINKIKPDFLLLSSLFDGAGDNTVTSIGLMPSNFSTATILYDLIPLIEPKKYLAKVPMSNWYYRKLDSIKRADILLAISNSAKKEGIEHLGFEEDRIVNISSAADPSFNNANLTPINKSQLFARYGIKRKFLMHSSAFDERKNFEGLVKAFGLLPNPLRKNFQLVLVCGLNETERNALTCIASEAGLNPDDLVLTGFVTDSDLIALYSECYLFVFPSFSEGFGLPALEAMSCGAPVIGSNTTSIPEVIGREDALFDPYSLTSIAEKITQVLTNEAYRKELIQHSIEQSKCFSWDKCAQNAISTMEKQHTTKLSFAQIVNKSIQRPKLAFVSPLPPERSGISDYSAELLPELARFYQIEIIVAQDTISDPWIVANYPLRTVEWFKSHADHYDRVLYQFGNSYYHQHMFDLISIIPGVITLHDYYLSALMIHVLNNVHPNIGVRELYLSHGYKAVQEYYLKNGTAVVVDKYPCNKTILEHSLGVIVHSEYSKNLAREWFNISYPDNWSLIPLLRTPANINMEKKREARIALGINENTFVVCSFGMLASSKQNHRLLDAWLASSLSKNKDCLLVFVGENDSKSNYGLALISKISTSGLIKRICITGWVDATQFHLYLATADIGVQLRTHSRGETSGTVLDCMNYGLPTIVNANGSLADLPKDAVWMLPDDFEDSELVNALETLWESDTKRTNLGARSRAVILKQHAPHACAKQYMQAIERYHTQAQSGKSGLIKAIAQIENAPIADDSGWAKLAQSISQNNSSQAHRQLLVDVSALVKTDLKTGIQRVVRSIFLELLSNPPDGYRVEPIYADSHDAGYRYARQFTLRFLECPDQVLIDEPIDFSNGDIFLGLDLQPDVVSRQASTYELLRRLGIQVYFVVYDLLPTLLSQVFTDGSYTWFSTWLETIAQMDGVICISRTVANDMAEWLSVFDTKRLRPFKLGWFHLGADVTSSAPTTGLPANAEKILSIISSCPTFLMVGTIEPRKGYLQTLSAFEQLWANGININLVIVGSEGWKPLPESARRTIPETIAKIKNNHELNQRLFWLENVSDEYLEKIYAASTCLIAASEGEGFGLPLIEAAQHKLPIIARDIPVFREVAGDNAYYFSGLEISGLAKAIRDWLDIEKAGKAPQSDAMPWMTWKQSTQNLLNVVLYGQWHQYWMPDGVLRFWGSDNRLFTQIGNRIGRDIRTTGAEGFLIYGPYLPIVAGQYCVKIYGQFDKNSFSEAHIDFAVNKGEIISGRCDLGKPDDSGCLVTLPILLDTNYSDFEIRIWVSEGCELCVHKIEISNNT
jgi:glycosyltransferase involved in cell wall biosynthesis